MEPKGIACMWVYLQGRTTSTSVPGPFKFRPMFNSAFAESTDPGPALFASSSVLDSFVFLSDSSSP